MTREQVLRFRLERQGLGERDGVGPVGAAACPASDFNRDAALLALAARSEKLTRSAYERAVDDGKVVLAPAIRAAIHALQPADFALLGRALISDDEEELGRQIGQQMRRIVKETGVAATDALAEVSEATEAALPRGSKLSKNGLHDGLRERVREELMPWCKGCDSHHVAPMLWRYAGVRAGVRRDHEARYLLGSPKPKGKPDPADAVRYYLRFYGPAKVSHFASWSGVAPAMSRRLWDLVAEDLVVVDWDGGEGSILGADEKALKGAGKASGLRLLPPGDPYLLQQDRETLVPEAATRKRMFRPVASPGAVLVDGRIAGTWKVKAKRKRSEFEVTEIARVPRRKLEAEAERIAALRGSEGLALSVA